MIAQALRRVRARLCRPTHALPIDVFRILVGLLSFVYFLHLFAQVGDFSSPSGLIDHALTRELFWYTRFGLFGPWMSADAFRLIYAFAAIGSLALAAGYRVRIMAFALYLVAVSAYRWNFLVIYVDDSLMHLSLFWLILLPTGKTLVLTDWLRDRQVAIERWKREIVPGTAMRCFLINLAMVDLIAGLWKLTSPMWRNGTAVHAVLRMPLAYAPELWEHGSTPIFQAANYGAIALELMLPVVFLVALHPRVKWVFAAGAVSFHLGILATLMIPYANLACLAALVLVFRTEIMAAVAGQHRMPVLRADPAIRFGWSERVAVSFTFLLALAMIGEVGVPSWRFPGRDGAARIADGRVGFMRTEHNVLYVPLWFLGIAQSYRLFDWIDDRNFRVHYDMVEHQTNGANVRLDPAGLFPHSLRSVLLQAYLLDGTWGRVPGPRAPEFKQGLFDRFAQRYCGAHLRTGMIDVSAAVDRVSVGGEETHTSRMIMKFDCGEGRAVVAYPHLDTDQLASRR